MSLSNEMCVTRTGENLFVLVTKVLIHSNRKEGFGHFSGASNNSKMVDESFSLRSSSSSSSGSSSSESENESEVSSILSSDKELEQHQQEGMGQPRTDKFNEFDDEIDQSNVIDDNILNPYPKVEDNMVEDDSYHFH